MPLSPEEWEILALSLKVSALAIVGNLPIAFALMFAGVALMLLIGQFDSQIVVQNAIAGADNFVLMAVPFFILAGEFMNAGGLSKRIVEMASAFVGHLRGGLAQTNVVLGALIGGPSGAGLADAAMICKVLVPEMTKAGYIK